MMKDPMGKVQNIDEDADEVDFKDSMLSISHPGERAKALGRMERVFDRHGGCEPPSPPSPNDPSSPTERHGDNRRKSLP